MSEPIGERHDRTVRLQTAQGSIVGRLLVSPRLRTLDDLNVVAKSFVTLHAPRLSGMDWPFDGRPLAVNKDFILFVAEVTPMPPRPGSPFGSGFTRGTLRVRVGEFDVRGSVHLPRGGASLARLSHDTHPFVAMTSASVTGPDLQLTAPFLAVSRRQILAAQEIRDDASELVGVTDEARGEPVEE